MNKFEAAAFATANIERNKTLDVRYKRRGCTKRGEAKNKASSVENMMLNSINLTNDEPTSMGRVWIRKTNGKGKEIKRSFRRKR